MESRRLPLPSQLHRSFVTLVLVLMAVFLSVLQEVRGPMTCVQFRVVANSVYPSSSETKRQEGRGSCMKSWKFQHLSHPSKFLARFSWKCPQISRCRNFSVLAWGQRFQKSRKKRSVRNKQCQVIFSFCP